MDKLWNSLTEEQRTHVVEYSRRLIDGSAPALETLQKVERLPEPMRGVMRLRLLYGLKWEEVAARSHYTERWCQTLRKKAESMMQGMA